MGWLKRILQGSTSNSRQRSNGSCEVDDRRSCSNEPNDTEDESTEGEETDYQIARFRSFSEDGQAHDLYGAALSKDWVQYEELKLEDEDERPTQSFQQRKQYHGSYEDVDRPYSDEVNDSADELTDHGDKTYHRNPHSSLVSGEGQGWATYGPLQYEGSPMQHREEQLSEAVDHSLVIGSSSLFDTANIFQSLPFSFYPDNGQTTQHPECIHPYAFDDPVIANHKNEYHSNLNIYYKEHHHPTPYVCREPIQVDASGHLQYREHPFWPGKYC